MSKPYRTCVYGLMALAACAAFADPFWVVTVAKVGLLALCIRQL
jgi:hypothetical protein